MEDDQEGEEVDPPLPIAEDREVVAANQPPIEQPIQDGNLEVIEEEEEEEQEEEAKSSSEGSDMDMEMLEVGEEGPVRFQDPTDRSPIERIIQRPVTRGLSLKR